MDNSRKRALMGFDRVSFFPIVKNSTTEYEVGEKMAMPWVQSMTKDKDVAESKIYGDDSLYLNVTNFNGLTAELTVAEMPLELMGKLGFGDYDSATNTLKWNPQGKNLEFGMTFRCLQADGQYRMYRMYRFQVNGVTEGENATKGDSAAIQPYVISGMFAPRALDAEMGAIKDGTAADADWLDEIPDDSSSQG